MGVVSALFTLLYVGANGFLIVSNLLLPLPVVIIDAILLVFWLTTMSGFGNSGFLSVNCKYPVATSFSVFSSTGPIITYKTDMVCTTSKAIFTFSFFSL